MRKCPNPEQLAIKQDRIEEIRMLLCENQLTTQQIEYLTGINQNTLRHYLIEMQSNGLIAFEKLRVKKSPNLNLYRVTADGRSVKPKPVAIKQAADTGCHRDCLVTAFFGSRNVAA
jgi:DNA-binding HxlR family transcriptional regulator